MEQRNDNPQGSESAKMASKMPNLSNLGCGAAGATRIEAYSKGEGHAHSELEATFYTCAEHTGPAVESIEATGLTAHQMPLGDDPYRAACGAGFDFATRKPARAAGETADVFGDDHPTVTAAIMHICHDDLALLPYTRRQLAERLLGEWEHNESLTDREREAILSRFPEKPIRPNPAPKIDDAHDDGDRHFRDVLEAFKVGFQIGQKSIKTTEAFSRGYVEGYVEGLDDRRNLRPEAGQ